MSNDRITHAIELLNQNKITKSNAWQLTVIDDLEDVVKHRSIKDMNKAALALAAAVKVYEQRVNSLLDTIRHMESTKARPSKVQSNCDENNNASAVDGSSAIGSSSTNNVQPINIDHPVVHRRSRPRRHQKSKIAAVSTLNMKTCNTNTLPDPMVVRINATRSVEARSTRTILDIFETNDYAFVTDPHERFFDDTEYEPIVYAENDEYDYDEESFVRLPLNLPSKRMLRQNLRGFRVEEEEQEETSYVRHIEPQLSFEVSSQDFGQQLGNRNGTSCVRADWPQMATTSPVFSNRSGPSFTGSPDIFFPPTPENPISSAASLFTPSHSMPFHSTPRRLTLNSPTSTRFSMESSTVAQMRHNPPRHVVKPVLQSWMQMTSTKRKVARRKTLPLDLNRNLLVNAHDEPKPLQTNFLDAMLEFDSEDDTLLEEVDQPTMKLEEASGQPATQPSLLIEAEPMEENIPDSGIVLDEEFESASQSQTTSQKNLKLLQRSDSDDDDDPPPLKRIKMIRNTCTNSIMTQIQGNGIASFGKVYQDLPPNTSVAVAFFMTLDAANKNRLHLQKVPNAQEVFEIRKVV